MKNKRFLNALMRQPVDKTPVWLMRQAGRYLPEYRAVRAQAGDFMTLCKTPELACEVTLQPLRRYDLDAAIVFSDILTIPDAMGLGLHFVEGEGPRFERPIRSLSDIKNLSVPSSELDYVMETIRLVRHELDGKVPLIGFSGSPWTLACYMIEGESSRDFMRIKSMLYQEPAALHQLLAILTKSVVAYLQAQIAAGAQAIMIFDTWGGILTPRDYQLFSLDYMTQIVSALDIPTILFTKNGGQWLEQIAASGCNAIGIDWMTSLSQAKERVGHQVALQGNMDPAILAYGSPERIREEVSIILESYGKGPGHIFNLGHGIVPQVPPENVSILIEAVHDLSRRYH